MPVANSLQALIERAGQRPRVTVAVADAAQKVVLQTMREAVELGIAEPRLIGEAPEISTICRKIEWDIKPEWLVDCAPDGAAAAHGARRCRRYRDEG